MDNSTALHATTSCEVRGRFIITLTNDISVSHLSMVSLNALVTQFVIFNVRGEFVNGFFVFWTVIILQ
jgi:hypothetical protein